jgi:hypothetical protein
MSIIIHDAKNVKSYFFQSFQYPNTQPLQKIQGICRESVIQHRDDIIWHLLCSENRVAVNDLVMYWEIIDAMMDLSVQSAMQLLQNASYERVDTLLSEALDRLQEQALCLIR